MHHYVIVGAGTAGSVLASRLSENPDVRVLLLEAGSRASRSAEHRTVPQASLFERRLRWRRDIGLAADASASAPMAQHSPRAAYDQWAADGGWSYAAMQPSLRRLETHTGDDESFSVTDLASPHPLAQAFVRAAVAAGWPFEANLASAPREGVGLHRIMQQGGRPCRAAAAYLQPARRRQNLTVTTGAHVRRIDVEDGRATGVSYVEDGLAWSAEAERAVILCAGAVGSPHLLMRSGIGPAGHLRDRGVEVIRNLPGVGRGLQDPLAVDVAGSADGAPWPPQPPPEASAFLSTHADPATPDLQLRFGPAAPAHGVEAAPGRAAVAVRCALLRPQSRGRLTLRPDDPEDLPILDPQYLSDPTDLATLVTGLRQTRRLLRQRPFARFNPVETQPGLGKTTGAELRAYVRLHSEHAGAPAGTCRMGPGEAAVVDQNLRVRGVGGLRVADASVMPAAVRGTTALPLVALAECAAALLRQQTAPVPTGR